MLENIKSNLGIFFSESTALILVYAAFAIVVCLALSALEYSNQSSELPFSQLAIKSALLLLATVAGFILSSYITGWHYRLLGGEVIASILVATVWVVGLYYLNARMSQGMGLELVNGSRYGVVSAVILVFPFIGYFGFIWLLAKGMQN
ncbi:MAG: hypothetical protein ABJ013_07990 [Halioglobus sp.]